MPLPAICIFRFWWFELSSLPDHGLIKEQDNVFLFFNHRTNRTSRTLRWKSDLSVQNTAVFNKYTAIIPVVLSGTKTDCPFHKFDRLRSHFAKFDLQKRSFFCSPPGPMVFNTLVIQYSITVRSAAPKLKTTLWGGPPGPRFEPEVRAI